MRAALRGELPDVGAHRGVSVHLRGDGAGAGGAGGAVRLRRLRSWYCAGASVRQLLVVGVGAAT